MTSRRDEGPRDDAPDMEATGFLENIRRHGDKVYNFARRLAGNAPDADELVQEALTRAYEHRTRYDPTKPFDAWLCRIVHNLFMDRCRSYEHRHGVSFDAPPPDEGAAWLERWAGPDDDPLAELENNERGRLAQEALKQVPETFRAALTLCDIEGFSYEDIRDILGCPLGTVRSRIHEGRIRLRNAFDNLMKGGTRVWTT